MSVLARAAADLGTGLSETDYEAWRADNEPSAPSFRTFTRRFGSWNESLRRAGVRPGRHSPRRWSDDELEDAVRAAAAAVGEPLQMTDYAEWRERQRDPGRWPPTTAFKGWIETCARAHVTPGQYQLRYSDEELLDHVREFSRGEPISAWTYDKLRAGQLRRRQVPSSGSIMVRFGSWPAALRRAGVEPLRERWNDEAITAALKAAIEAHGGPINQSQYREWTRRTAGVPSLSTVVRRVADFDAAVAKVARSVT